MFLLVSNVFMEASRLYYSADIAPSFWSWLRSQHEEGNICSIAHVRKEINDGKEGYLTRWASDMPSSFWIAPDQLTAASLSALSAWASDPGRPYTPAARKAFLESTDYMLVAQAHASDCVVVTREQSQPNAKRAIKIPDACAGMSVPTLDPFSMYRKLCLRFAAD